MDKRELIFLAAVIIILLAVLCIMPEFRFISGILLVIGIIILLMFAIINYRQKYKNHKISIIFTIIGIVIFIILFANSVYADFTNNEPVISGFILVILFIISMAIGWFFEEK